MRAISFVNRLEFDFPGNVFQNALTFGDVDNDGGNELVVGNLSGDLAVFKHDRVWQKMSGFGWVTAIAVGDVLNCGRNAVVVVGGDGWVHILVLEEGAARLKAVHVQRIPPNTKTALLGDIDGDGHVELVLGLTDRVVRSYRWLSGSSGSNGGRLLGLNKWECANQIGTVSLTHAAEGSASLLVSQPGGSYMEIRCDAELTQGNGLVESTVEYHPLSLCRMRNASVSTEILGDIHTSDGGACRFAVATVDGTVMLVEDQQVLWSLQVEQQLFAIRRLDVTGDGRDEIVACAWNGQTYILDQDRRSVRFQLEEAVESFTAGLYASNSHDQRPSIVYTTFTDKIYIYPDVHIPSMVAYRFQPKLGLEESQERLVTEWCLYGPR